ncbi:hypothetical protein AAMO2058_001304200 [Amorphochlora amoebiformis]
MVICDMGTDQMLSIIDQEDGKSELQTRNIIKSVENIPPVTTGMGIPLPRSDIDKPTSSISETPQVIPSKPERSISLQIANPPEDEDISADGGGNMTPGSVDTPSISKASRDSNGNGVTIDMINDALGLLDDEESDNNDEAKGFHTPKASPLNERSGGSSNIKTPPEARSNVKVMPPSTEKASTQEPTTQKTKSVSDMVSERMVNAHLSPEPRPRVSSRGRKRSTSRSRSHSPGPDHRSLSRDSKPALAAAQDSKSKLNQVITMESHPGIELTEQESAAFMTVFKGVEKLNGDVKILEAYKLEVCTRNSTSASGEKFDAILGRIATLLNAEAERIHKLGKEPQPKMTGQESWGKWQEPEAKKFKVRGNGYSTKRRKVPSEGFLFPLQHVEFIKAASRMDHVCAKNKSWWQLNRPSSEAFGLIFNIQHYNPTLWRSQCSLD